MTYTCTSLEILGKTTENLGTAELYITASPMFGKERLLVMTLYFFLKPTDMASAM